jgi:hypothetical protein
MTLDIYSHTVQALEIQAAVKVDAALRKKYGQHFRNADRGEQNKKRNLMRCKSFDGGRERSRTSDLYSVNVALYP